MNRPESNRLGPNRREAIRRLMHETLDARRPESAWPMALRDAVSADPSLRAEFDALRQVDRELDGMMGGSADEPLAASLAPRVMERVRQMPAPAAPPARRWFVALLLVGVACAGGMLLTLAAPDAPRSESLAEHERGAAPAVAPPGDEVPASAPAEHPLSLDLPIVALTEPIRASSARVTAAATALSESTQGIMASALAVWPRLEVPGS